MVLPSSSTSSRSRKRENWSTLETYQPEQLGMSSCTLYLVLKARTQAFSDFVLEHKSRVLNGPFHRVVKGGQNRRRFAFSGSPLKLLKDFVFMQHIDLFGHYDLFSFSMSTSWMTIVGADRRVRSHKRFVWDMLWHPAGRTRVFRRLRETLNLSCETVKSIATPPRARYLGSLPKR